MCTTHQSITHWPFDHLKVSSWNGRRTCDQSRGSENQAFWNTFPKYVSIKGDPFSGQGCSSSASFHWRVYSCISLLRVEILNPVNHHPWPSIWRRETVLRSSCVRLKSRKIRLNASNLRHPLRHSLSSPSFAKLPRVQGDQRCSPRIPALLKRPNQSNQPQHPYCWKVEWTNEQRAQSKSPGQIRWFCSSLSIRALCCNELQWCPSPDGCSINHQYIALLNSEFCFEAQLVVKRFTVAQGYSL